MMAMTETDNTVQPAVLKHWQLSELSLVLSAQIKGNDVHFDNVSTDTRAIKKGALFIALVGPNFDGHDYVKEAENRGAVALLVDREVTSPLPQIIVRDTRLALGQFAAAWRAGFEIPVVGVTGSNGKTTVKEMIAAILGQQAPVLMTQGNLNNDIGLPLTLFNLAKEHKHAVIEMGANHPGEIDYLTHIAQPNVAVITNAANAHLEGFGSIEGVAHAKGEIFGGLSQNGVGIINADDHYFELWSGLLKDHKVISFGLENKADVSASWKGDAIHSDINITFPGGEVKCVLHVPGKHNVMNALAATAATLAVGIPAEQIKAGLESFRSVKGRLQTNTGFNGAVVIDDTYNANPTSLSAAIDVLSSCGGEKVLVLGDMGELGKDAQALHNRTIEYAIQKCIQRIFTLGELTGTAIKAYPEQGKNFDSTEQLVAALKPLLDKNTTVLVKGSRFMHMETVVHGLLEKNN